MIPRSWTLALLASVSLLITLFVSPSGAAQAAAGRPLVAVIGDSYTAGWGAPTSKEAWWRYAAAELGWTPGTIIGDPVGGYARNGHKGTFAQALRAQPLNPATD